jgi:hypothetical protein
MRDHYSEFRSQRALGLSLRTICDNTGITYYRSRQFESIYLKEIHSGKPAVVEEPKAAAKAAQKPEKKKPVRITAVNERQALLKKGIVHRVIITSAQDDTPIFTAFWTNLLAYMKFLGAQLFVGGYTYQLGLYEDHAIATASYAPELAPYLAFERTRLLDDLLYVGDANVLPTTANPLNGWMTANRGGHVIIPHARVALDSIPRMQAAEPHFAISTGTVTMPSYTPRAAGRKSLFHHTFGALLIEIDTDGQCFFRHLLAAEDGSFQDLTHFIDGGVVYPDSRDVICIVWGDIHTRQLNRQHALKSFGYDTTTRGTVKSSSMLNALRPMYQCFHDVLDFRARNHHGICDPHQRSLNACTDNESVEDELDEVAKFVAAVQRDWCRTAIIESNHDCALARWLKDPQGQFDAENAYLWHHLNGRWHGAYRQGDLRYNVVRDALAIFGLEESDTLDYVVHGESYEIAGIEHGLHGDVGINGARGSAAGLRKMAPKINAGHTHTPRILDGYYSAGVNGNLKMGYNESGPTTWAYADIVTYASGKRTIINKTSDGRWRVAS